jgi:hypothetical protein
MAVPGDERLECDHSDKRCVGTWWGRDVYFIGPDWFYVKMDGGISGNQSCCLWKIPQVEVKHIKFDDAASRGAPG